MNSPADNERRSEAAMAEEAGAWDARLRAPDCTDEDRARFAAWRDSNPAHQQAFERLQSIVATLRSERGRADLRALRDEALRVAGHRRRRVWFAGTAAAVVAVVSCVIAWNNAEQGWLSQHIATFVTRLSGAQSYSTGIGQRSTFMLADGSSIELNARSRVQVRFSDVRRDVELVEGQALFNVAKDSRRPFIVQAGDRQVLAVGTKFDVRLDATSVQVTLIEGKVRIEERAAENGAPLANEAAQIVLTPGKQLVARLNTTDRPAEVPRPVETATEVGSVDVVRDIDVTKITAWREGRIYFDDLSLEQAVTEMNRHSTMRIRIDSAALAGLRVNGMFKAGEQESFVSALQEYFPITAHRRGDREIVLTER